MTFQGFSAWKPKLGMSQPLMADIELALVFKSLLRTLFGDDHNKNHPQRKISCPPVKWAKLAIPDPTSSAVLCSHVLAAFRGVEETF
jgi:hypothetical protein